LVTHETNRSRHLKRIILSLAGLLLVVGGGLLILRHRTTNRWHGEQKLIILGIDGMDPQLLKQFIQEGRMPNFSKLMQQGSFRPLTTSIPRKARWPGRT